MKIKKLINLKNSGFVPRIVLISSFLLCFSSVSAQTDLSILNKTVYFENNSSKNLSDYKFLKAEEKTNSTVQKSALEIVELKLEISDFDFTDSGEKQPDFAKPDFQISTEHFQIEKNSSPNTRERFHWKPALAQSGIFLGIQHSFRMTQDKTTRELKGKFIKDWGRSVRNLRGWGDGDSIFTNYVAHPLQGAATGRIFVNNSDFAKKQEFGKSKAYWESRFKAMGWSAVWSAQFELGPISEASIGNVGLNKVRGHSTMAYVDLVVTPVVGTGVLIGEDAIDKYVLKNWLERKVGDKTTLKLLRSVLTPTTSFTNLLRGKAPWKRDSRTL